MIRGLVSRIGARPLIRSRLVAFGSKSTSQHPQNTEGTKDAATGKSRVTSSLGVSKNVKATRAPRSVGWTAKRFKGQGDETLPNWQNEHIQAAETPKEVLDIITSWKRKKNFGHINCFLALERLVQVGKGSEAGIRGHATFQVLLTNLHGHLTVQPPVYPSRIRARILKAFVSLDHNPGPVFMDDLLSLWMGDGLDKLDPTHLAALINMVASVGHKPSLDFVRQAAEACVAKSFAEAQPAALADLVMGLWRLHNGPPPVDGFLDALSEACVSRGASQLGFRDLPKLLAGVTKMYGTFSTHPQLCRVLLDGALGFGLRNLHPNAMATFIKTVGTLPLSQAERTQLLGECEKPLLEGGFARFETRRLMIVLYGLSQLGRPKVDVIRAFVAECGRRGFHRLAPADLGGILFALHRLKYCPSEHMLKKLAAACKKIDFRQPKAGLSVAQVAFSFARFNYHDTELMDTLVASWQKPPPPAPDARPEVLHERVRDLTNLLHGLASLLHFPGHGFLNSVLEACTEVGFQHFRPLSSLGTVLQNLSRLNHYPGIEWVNDVVAEYGRRPERTVRFHDLSMLLWSLAAMGLLERLACSHASFPPLMQVLLERMEHAADEVVKAQARRQQEDRPEWKAEQAKAARLRDDFTALTHALASLELAGTAELRDVRTTLRACLERMGPISGLAPPTPSYLQRSVVECLHTMGFVTQDEPVLRGPLSLDAVLLPVSPEANGVPLGVEVDGPYHFFQNKLWLRNGRAAYKMRLMSLAVSQKHLSGFIKVPYFKWWRAIKNHATREYLLSLLMQCPADLRHYLPPDSLKQLPPLEAADKRQGDTQEAQGTEEADESEAQEDFTAAEMREAQQQVAPTAPPVEMPDEVGFGVEPPGGQGRAMHE